MKKLAGFLTVLVLLQCGVAFAQSDYATIDTYKKKHQSLLESIKTAQEVGQCANLESAINNLEADYTEHKELLGEALHPESFDTSITALRDQLNKSTERIALAERSKKAESRIDAISKKAAADGKTIEEILKQNSEYQASLEKLNLEVKDLSSRIQQLSAENTGLLKKIEVLQLESRKDKESIAKLKELTEKLAANIRDRDDLIIKMMDGFANEYSKAGLTDTQQKNLFINTQGNDYVGKIIATVNENVKYVETAPLAPQDVEIIRAEQRRLTTKWNEIRPYVGKLYPDEQNKIQDLASVDSRLSEWEKGIDEATWKGVHQVFVKQNVEIGSFHTAEEFQARLLVYLDDQIQNPSRGKYQAFKNSVWDSPIKDQWLPVIPTAELTAKHRADIEERMILWEKKISALVWRWVLIGVFGIAVIAVVVVLVLRNKKKPGTPVEEEVTEPAKYPTN